MEENNNITKTEENKFKLFPFFNNKQPILVLILLSVLFYINSINNEYALDDGIAIHQNSNVIKGVTGIPEIFSSDVYKPFYERMNASDQLAGGRYRPLTIASYAIEQEVIQPYRTGNYMFSFDINNNGKLDDDQVLGNDLKRNYEYNSFTDLNGDGAAQPNECNTCWDSNKNFKDDVEEDINNDGVFNEIDCQVSGADLRHFVNIMLYMLCCIALFLFLKNYLMPQLPDVAFLASILFLIHPVHTEVVAYIFGRAELLALLFGLITLIFSCKFQLHRNVIHLIIASFAFLLALLSNESALVLIIILPLTWYFTNTLKNSEFIVGALAFILLVYLGARVLSTKFINNVSDTEVLNNPYVFANGEENIATRISVLLLHLKQSLLPYPLICDYNYSSITYKTFADWQTLLALIIYSSLFVVGIKLCKQKNYLGYGIMLYLIYSLSVANFIIQTQTLFNETLLFHATLGICIALAYVIVKVFEKIKNARTILISSIIALTGVCALIVIPRNLKWKNDVSLFLTDAKTQPKSVLVLGNAGARWIDLADTKEITGVDLPNMEGKPFNDYNGTLVINEEDLITYNATTKREAALKKGIDYLDTAIKYHPKYVNGYLNLGLAHFKLNKDKECVMYWKRAEILYPKNPYLNNYYQVYRNVLLNKAKSAKEKNDFIDAEKYLLYLLFVDASFEEGLEEICTLYFETKHYKECRMYLNKLLKINSKNNVGVQLHEQLDKN